MTPLDFWLPPWLKLPLSGNVNETIAPSTSWFSPTVELNYAGDRQIEGDVVANVASFGTQLGIIIDAVLALGQHDKSPAMQALATLAKRIEERKQQHRDDLLSRTRSDLEALRLLDAKAFERLIEDFGKPPEPGKAARVKRRSGKVIAG